MCGKTNIHVGSPVEHAVALCDPFFNEPPSATHVGDARHAHGYVYSSQLPNNLHPYTLILYTAKVQILTGDALTDISEVRQKPVQVLVVRILL